MAKTAEKAVMVGARISPKLQYGLRLLARVQGRTIAEAVEWSISLALRQTRIGNGEERLNKVVDTAWEKSSDAQRIEYLRRKAPELLDFDERAAWNLVIRCAELWEEAFYGLETDADGDHVLVRVAKDDPNREEQWDDRVPLFPIIEKHWEAIKSVGNALGKAGEIEMRFTLAQILDGTALKLAGID
ncbi:hypothetical protein J2X06_003393 [Lysobacter niastensis]|uniref:Uncharacterized protein n=1 Tax=Lysobacter niastensis TaxID=380629 RepID=A0ABU1WF01_9GAMM|nr:hypothetical protein [Lysobacter niastensis]MDR7136175.1 hypothetical protein [Lysobacter niastensis]